MEPLSLLHKGCKTIGLTVKLRLRMFMLGTENRHGLVVATFCLIYTV